MQIVVDMSETVEHPCQRCMDDEAAYRLGRGGELCAGCVTEEPEETVLWVSIPFQRRRH